MSMKEDVARALVLVKYPAASKRDIDDMWDAFQDEAQAAIAIVLDRVNRELAAVQYDPAPYTAMKYRLRALSEEQTR